MAISAGAAVANIYYNQPLLKHIALAFNTSESEAGLTSTLTQIGYGIGLFFIIPLGDKLNRKKLILSLLLALIVSLALMTLAPNIQTVWLMSVMIGIMFQFRSSCHWQPAWTLKQLVKQ
jgi:predicted MFS family arabinose efflux permease